MCRRRARCHRCRRGRPAAAHRSIAPRAGVPGDGGRPRTGSASVATGASPHATRSPTAHGVVRSRRNSGHGTGTAASARWNASDTASTSSNRPGSCAPSSQRVADHPSSAHVPSGSVIGPPTRNSVPPSTCASTVASHATSRSSATGFSTTGPARNDPPCPPGRRVTCAMSPPNAATTTGRRCGGRGHRQGVVPATTK